MMMLVTKDSEDDVDLDQEVAYHVCVAARARRDDVRRAYTICEIFNTEISVGFTLSKHKRYEWFHAGCHARASKREAPRADAFLPSAFGLKCFDGTRMCRSVKY